MSPQHPGRSSATMETLQELLGRVLKPPAAIARDALALEQQEAGRIQQLQLQLTGGGAEPIEPRTTPPLIQAAQTIGHVVRDPVGTVVGVFTGTVEDLKLISQLVPEEIADEEMRTTLQSMGLDPDKLAPLAEANRQRLTLAEQRQLEIAETLGEAKAREERGKARQRLMALGLGVVAGGATGLALRGAVASGAISGTAATAIDAAAFGTVAGAAAPVEETQTRLGNILSTNAVAIPLATAGGVVASRVAQLIRRRGIKPQIEAPEVAPPTEAPLVQMQQEAGLGGRMSEGARIAAERLEQPGALERGQAHANVRQSLTESEIAARKSPPGGSLDATLAASEQVTQQSLAASAANNTAARQGALSVLGETLGAVLERARSVEPIKTIADAEKRIAKLEREGLTPEAADILRNISIDAKTGRRPINWDEFYTKYLDDLHPVNVATRGLLEGIDAATATKPPGVRLPGIEDPYVLARLTRGSVGKANTFLESGPLDFATLQPVGPGLREILRPVQDIQRLDLLRSYLVSRRTIELAGRGIESPFNLGKAIKTVEHVEATSPQLVQATQQLGAYQNAILQYMQDSGILSEAQVGAMRAANQAYVPFYRFIEQTVDPFPQFFGPQIKSKRLANLRSGIRRIKGDTELKVVDPFESIVRNTYAFVELADRQAVSEALVRLAETYETTLGEIPAHIIERTTRPVKPIDISSAELKRVLRDAGIPDDQLGALTEAATIFRPTEQLGEGVIWAVRGGQREFYRVDSALYKSLLALDRERIPQMMALLQYPARTMRAGATLSPAFIARNPFRDQFTAAVNSRYGFKPIWDLGRGLFHVLQRDRLYEQFRRSGGEHATLVRSTSGERLALQKTLKELLASENAFSQAFRTASNPRGWLEGLRRVSEAMEEASRSQEFVRAFAATGDPRLSGFAAREVTLDFARMGTQMRIMNQITPFMNAQIQGVDKLIRTFRENPARASAIAMASITMPSLLLYLINRDDPVYQELSEARKDFFWNFPIWEYNEVEGRPMRTGEFFSVPKPFELGMAFGTYPERVLRWIETEDPAALDELARNTFSSVTPSILPTAVQVPMSALTGYNFFTNRQIIPEREKAFLPPFQAGPRQGETVRVLGKVFNVSPRIVEETVRGFTAGLGMEALRISDTILRSVAGVQSVADVPAVEEQLPLIGTLAQAFLVPEPTLNARSVQRFYQAWEQSRAAMQTAEMLQSEGRLKELANIINGLRTELATYPIFAVGPSEGVPSPIEQLANIRREIARTRALNIPQENKDRFLLNLGRMYRIIASATLTKYRIQKEQLSQPPLPLSEAGTTVVPIVGNREDGIVRVP